MVFTNDFCHKLFPTIFLLTQFFPQTFYPLHWLLHVCHLRYRGSAYKEEASQQRDLIYVILNEACKVQNKINPFRREYVYTHARHMRQGLQRYFRSPENVSLIGKPIHKVGFHFLFYTYIMPVIEYGCEIWRNRKALSRKERHQTHVELWT